MNPKRVHVNFASDPNVVYTSINTRNIKCIVYIYIHFNQNVDEKSDISAKIETGKHLHTFFLLTRNSVNDVMPSPTSNQILESHGLF